LDVDISAVGKDVSLGDPRRNQAGADNRERAESYLNSKRHGLKNRAITMMERASLI
jgi:hypothetical protein